jgi:hypothetical protein
MKILAAIIMLTAFASAQAPQQQQLTIIGSYGNGLSGPGCVPTSWYGYGKDYPIKCIRLLSTKEKLVYTIMKEDDTWCLVGEEFCKK